MEATLVARPHHKSKPPKSDCTYRKLLTVKGT